MKLENAKIDIFINSEYTTINLHDSNSNCRFVSIKLTPEQLSSALSRTPMTDCEIEVIGLDIIGKKMEHKIHKFEIPSSLEYRTKDAELNNLILELGEIIF